jgi:hypothetical protein
VEQALLKEESQNEGQNGHSENDSDLLISCFDPEAFFAA